MTRSKGEKTTRSLRGGANRSKLLYMCVAIVTDSRSVTRIALLMSLRYIIISGKLPN